jgi:hypothetical protein
MLPKPSGTHRNGRTTQLMRPRPLSMARRRLSGTQPLVQRHVLAISPPKETVQGHELFKQQQPQPPYRHEAGQRGAPLAVARPHHGFVRVKPVDREVLAVCATHDMYGESTQQALTLSTGSNRSGRRTGLSPAAVSLVLGAIKEYGRGRLSTQGMVAKSCGSVNAVGVVSGPTHFLPPATTTSPLVRRPVVVALAAVPFGDRWHRAATHSSQLGHCCPRSCSRHVVIISRSVGC